MGKTAKRPMTAARRRAVAALWEKRKARESWVVMRAQIECGKGELGAEKKEKS